MIGGLAIAIAAGAGIASLEGTGQPPASVPPTSGSSTERPDASRLLIYLVGTEAEKRALEADVATSPEWFSESYAAIDTQVRVLVFDPELEESLETLDRLLPEASIKSVAGPSVKLVDMR